MFTFGAMASGGGSNLRELLKHAKDGSLAGTCKFLIVNNGDCMAKEIAASYNVPVFHISAKTHPDALAYENAILSVFEVYPVDFLALAGYMKKLPDSLIEKYKNRILNVHPSLLPKFGGKGFYGMRVHEAVINAGEKESGATIHLVTSEFDEGPILSQAKVAVLKSDTPSTLAMRVLAQEHALYWETFRDYAIKTGHKS